MEKTSRWGMFRAPGIVYVCVEMIWSSMQLLDLATRLKVHGGYINGNGASMVLPGSCGEVRERGPERG